MRVLSEQRESKDLSFVLSPLFTTLVQNFLVTPLLATLPKLLGLKFFVCHTYSTPGGVLVLC